MTFKKLQDNCSYSIEKIKTKHYSIKADSRYIEFKHDGIIKDLFLIFQENSFEFEFILNDENFEILKDEALEVQKGTVEFNYVSDEVAEKIIVPDNLPTTIKKDDGSTYYLPSWRNNLARRINSKSHIYIAGAAGCLDKHTKVELLVSEEIFNKIIDLRKTTI